MRADILRPNARTLVLAAALVLVGGVPPESAPAGVAVAMAQNVPIPRLHPRRTADDPIAGLIRGGDPNPDTEEAQAADAGEPDEIAETGVDEIALSAFAVAADLLRTGDAAAATAAAYALADRASVDLIDWLIATSLRDDVPSERIAQIFRRLGDWPGQSLMQLRLEQALDRENASDADILAALGRRAPETDKAMVAVGRALLASGARTDAARLIRERWRQRNFSGKTETQIVDGLGELLRTEDHKARMDRQLYDRESEAATRTAKRLGADQIALAEAVVAAIRGRSAASDLLDSLPDSVADDPLVTYSRLQRLRRADAYEEAAELLASSTPEGDGFIDPDAWWHERRIVSRSLAEVGDAAAAYAVASGHAARSSVAVAEAEFHSGWYALEFLGKPDDAVGHFQRILDIANRPLSRSRGEYWLGRAHKAAGRDAAAATHFARAAGYTTTYYGQLALEETGASTLPISATAAADDDTISRFNDRLFVKVIRRLVSANLTDRSGVFFRDLAESLDDPAEIGLLVKLAKSAELDQLALQIGIIASGRGLAVDDLAFPTSAIPADAETGDTERALVYAIARQESRFNRAAVSSAGARGLMQLMPATARETARGLGLRYSRSRLTTDPGYNTRLGAAFLARMAGRFDGSYVLTFVSYNAGASRADQWIERFGDPRDPSVDVVNWVESIPFTETRNYVQRVMENLQVYRAQLGDPALAISRDLKRRSSS